MASSTGAETETLPFIDEHSRQIDAPAAAVWNALVRVLRRQPAGSTTLVRALHCDPPRGSDEFDGRSGEAVPGFEVVESEPGRRLVLRGRHRFARYSLSFVLEGDRLRARTHAAFPGVLGRLYRAAVIGSGGHTIITRRMLREIARAVR